MSQIEKYDVVIVGAGAGGGVAAGVLAEAGKSVLLLERGNLLSFQAVGRDHLRNMRLSQYGVNAGPDRVGNPRVWMDQQDYPHVVESHQGGYQNNAATVGGGTRVYGAQAWRFLPKDFRMATEYGIPKGSSLADWPITYDDLAPYYARIEKEMGVAADSEAAQKGGSPRAEPYPLPPASVNGQGQALRRGAEALGWHTQAVPLLVNTVPYNGRPACIQCQHCVGFACPTDAKTGSQNTFLPRALATGRCDLKTEVMVERIETDEAGRVTGVKYWDRDGESVSVQSDVVVVAGGAIETARLLLQSRSSAHPNGLGNHSDQVGRHLQGHYYPTATGIMPEPIYDGIGPGASTATTDFNHGNDGIVGGGMLADDFVVLPIIFWKSKLPPELPRWGQAAKNWMRENYTRTLDVKGPVQEIPSPDGRVTLDPDVRDKWGIPVVRFSGTTHPETVRTAQFMLERALEWLRASGATQVWGWPPSLGLSGGQHQAGTCRMGDDPQTSVTDKWGRVHGHDNLYIADGSLHVTNGGFNPVLTILSLACRTAEHIASSW